MLSPTRDIFSSSAGGRTGIDDVGIVRAASRPDSSGLKVDQNGVIFYPQCINNGPGNVEAFSDRTGFTLVS